MPNQPKTKARSVRVPEDLWRAALGKADAKGTTLSDVIRTYLESWVNRAMIADPPACCVCGDWQVPRRVVLWNRDDDDPIALAAICENSEFCQSRAAANVLDGLAAAPVDPI